MKVDGKTWKQFFDDPDIWGEPGDLFYEDAQIYRNGVYLEWDDDPSLVDDTDIMQVKGGYLESEKEQNPLKGRSLESALRGWLKKSNIARFIVEVTREKEVELKEIIKSAGGKVL